MSRSARIPGIYVIRNRLNGRVYIGSSVDVPNRWRQHRRDLRAGTHKTKHLQAAWSKYGEEAFEFLLLEKCEDLQSRIQRETRFIQLFSPRLRYNTVEFGGVTTGYKHTPETLAKLSEMRRGRPLSEEHRAVLSMVRKGRPKSPEHREKLRLAQTGKRLSPETRAKISATKRAAQEMRLAS